MQFIDLAAQQDLIRDKIQANIQAVLAHGQYIMGPEIKELEKRLADFVGVEHAVACSSGTDALLLALMAYEVGPGDAVLTSPFTFIATAEVISLLGATPVFVDIDSRTFIMDPTHLERAIRALQKGASDYPLPASSNRASLKPRGIIGVDLFGLPGDYDAINAIAKNHGLFVIEDAAQSFGGQYKDKRACSLTDMGCTSFFPAKPLGCYGDGGMCFTGDEELAQKMRSLSVHGQGRDKYENVRIGINGRLDTLQAAILHAKFDIFPKEMELRQEVAAGYARLLPSAGNGLVTPHVPAGCQSVWAQYSVLAKNENHRSELQAKLKEAGIPTAIYYPKPLHLQTAFQGLGYRSGDFAVSEDCSRRIFSLPMHPYLTEEAQEQIAEVISQR
jgi:UDP-2-acetamido-2-deoxy-ribo-hexuluronate aminotransferase